MSNTQYNEKLKYLIRKNYVLEGGLKEAGDVNNIIPFDNIEISVGTSNPSNVVIPTFDEVIRVVSELKNTIFDTKYTLNYPSETGQTILPTAGELETAYTTDGIPATEADGTLVLLKAKEDGNEEFPVKQIAEGEGLLIVLEANGIFEEAGYSNGTWLIDQTKSQLPQELADIKTDIASNKTAHTILETRVTNIDKVDSEYLLKSNDKEIHGYGALVTDGTVTEGDKIARRDEITSALAGLKQTEVDNKKLQDAIKVTADDADKLSKANAGLIVHNTTNIATNVKDIATNKSDIKSNADKINININGISGAVVRLTAVETKSTHNDGRLTTVESTVLANANQIGVNQSKSEDNGKAITTLLSDVSSNTVAATDYANSKSDFVKIEDVQGGIDVHFDVPFTQSGKQTIADLSSVDMSKFVKGSIIVGVATPIVAGSVANEYGRDTYDDGASTDNVLVGQDVQVTITPTQLINEFATEAEAIDFAGKYHLTKLSQLTGAAGANIDVTARADASDARTLAVSAQTTADAADKLSKTNDGLIAINTGELNTRQPIIAANTKGVADNHAALVKVTSSASTNHQGVINNTAKISTNTTAIAAKQDKTDAALTTTTKSVVGAINELKTRSDNNEADVAELNLGKFDFDGTGKNVVTIFNNDGKIDSSKFDNDLTSLTTQDEIYNKTIVNKYYFIKSAADGIVELKCTLHSATQAIFLATVARTNIDSVVSLEFVANKGSASALSRTVVPIQTADPTQVYHAATKKYVDDKVATKTVTIPAVYGWARINDFFTSDKKYKDSSLRVYQKTSGIAGAEYEFDMVERNYNSKSLGFVSAETSKGERIIINQLSKDHIITGNGQEDISDNLYIKAYVEITPEQTVKVLA